VVSRYGANASLTIEPGFALPDAAGSAAYHVVIEALTNVRRHAGPASLVSVELTAAGVLTIRNSGDVGPARPGRRGGSGLDGLAERVREVGGTLAAGPFEGGWRVVCDLSRSADVRPGAGQQP
jgi:signal transduction histidine kinase